MKHLKTLRIEANEHWNESKRWIPNSNTKHAEYLWQHGYIAGAEDNQLKVPNRKKIVEVASEKYDSLSQINAFILGAEWAKKVYKKG